MLLSLVVALAAEQSLEVVVAAQGIAPETRLVAEVDWLGIPQRGDLLDDGRGDGDVAHDGLHLARFEGDRARSLRVVVVHGDTVIGESLVLSEGERDRVTFRVEEQPAGLVARRTAIAATAQGVERRELVQIVAMFGWTALLFLVAARLVRRR